MPDTKPAGRQIALFVEGDTERGDARRRTLPTFIHKWLDPQLPKDKRVGIIPVKFQGVSNYLDDLASKVSLYLNNRRAHFVVGLIDLYGIPTQRIDLSRANSINEKISVIRGVTRKLIPKQFQGRFRQHVAVHEIEAWLLAYPNLLSREKNVQSRIAKRDPESVNFNEPPAKYLSNLLGHYKKTTTAMNVFPRVEPQVAIDKCPYLKAFMNDILLLAKTLQ